MTYGDYQGIEQNRQVSPNEYKTATISYLALHMITAIRDYFKGPIGGSEFTEEDEKSVTIDDAHGAGEWAFMQGTFKWMDVVYP